MELKVGKGKDVFPTSELYPRSWHCFLWPDPDIIEMSTPFPS
jgi:hypothetical protein